LPWNQEPVKFLSNNPALDKEIAEGVHAWEIPEPKR
jgi:hypothetical protein